MEPRPGSGPSTLLIDPDASPGGGLARRLEALGATLDIAGEVAEFLDHYPERRFDLVVVDAAGPEAARDLAALRVFFGEGPATRILGVLRGRDPARAEMLAAAGCDRCVPPHRIVEAVAEELSRLATRPGAA